MLFLVDNTRCSDENDFIDMDIPRQVDMLVQVRGAEKDMGRRTI